MKVYITHHYPDLDSCMSIWLLSRFVYLGEAFDLIFVPVGKSIDNKERQPENIYIEIDTGGGIFDHHDINDYVCATSKVMHKYDLQNDKAINRMVDFALKVDHGLIFETDFDDFNLLNIIEGLNSNDDYDDAAVVINIMNTLDGVYFGLKNKFVAEKEIKNIIEVNTPWGIAAALETSNRKTRFLAHKLGYQIFIFSDPDKGYKGYTADGLSGVDFTNLYHKVKKKEPNSDWFLHSSLQLLLCGSSKAPDKKKSNLSLAEMIKIVEE